MELETFCWIEIEKNDGGTFPILFYDARDLSHDLNIISMDEVTHTVTFHDPKNKEEYDVLVEKLLMKKEKELVGGLEKELFRLEDEIDSLQAELKDMFEEV